MSGRHPGSAAAVAGTDAPGSSVPGGDLAPPLRRPATAVHETARPPPPSAAPIIEPDVLPTAGGGVGVGRPGQHAGRGGPGQGVHAVARRTSFVSWWKGSCRCPRRPGGSSPLPTSGRGRRTGGRWGSFRCGARREGSGCATVSPLHVAAYIRTPGIERAARLRWRSITICGRRRRTRLAHRFRRGG